MILVPGHGCLLGPSARKANLNGMGSQSRVHCSARFSGMRELTQMPRDNARLHQTTAAEVGLREQELDPDYAIGRVHAIRERIRTSQVAISRPDPGSHRGYSYKGYQWISLPLSNRCRNDRILSWRCSGNADGHTFLGFPYALYCISCSRPCWAFRNFSKAGLSESGRSPRFWVLGLVSLGWFWR